MTKLFNFMMYEIKAHLITHAYVLFIHVQCKMAEQHATSSKALMVRRSNIGRPKKFSQLWSSVMKRVYITAETCMKFRQLKKPMDLLGMTVLFNIF